jgi:hypothetical protein
MDQVGSLVFSHQFSLHSFQLVGLVQFRLKHLQFNRQCIQQCSHLIFPLGNLLSNRHYAQPDALPYNQAQRLLVIRHINLQINHRYSPQINHLLNQLLSLLEILHLSQLCSLLSSQQTSHLVNQRLNQANNLQFNQLINHHRNHQFNQVIFQLHNHLVCLHLNQV